MYKILLQFLKWDKISNKFKEDDLSGIYVHWLSLSPGDPGGMAATLWSWGISSGWVTSQKDGQCWWGCEVHFPEIAELPQLGSSLHTADISTQWQRGIPQTGKEMPLLYTSVCTGRCSLDQPPFDLFELKRDNVALGATWGLINTFFF